MVAEARTETTKPSCSKSHASHTKWYLLPGFKEWRRALLEPVIAAAPGVDGERGHVIRKLCSEPIIGPDGNTYVIKKSTIYNWIKDLNRKPPVRVTLEERTVTRPQAENPASRAKLQAKGLLGDPRQTKNGEEDHENRNWACGLYSNCLDYASALNWAGIDCRQCPGWGSTSPLKEAPSLQSSSGW